MRRILVPLDGTPLAASILSDARRLAGPDGELILVRDTGTAAGEYPVGVRKGTLVLEQAEDYLQGIAADLEQDGVHVETHALAILDPAQAIDVAAKIYKADLIACATHGRSPVGRLVRGGVAWRALVNSAVPIMLRHADERPIQASMFAPRRTIMVPLDGSEYAESALPLADDLAAQWNAGLVLAQVVPTIHPSSSPFATGHDAPSLDYQAEAAEAISYLDGIAETLRGPVVTRVLTGGVVVELVRCAGQNHVTDIVLASHGRTGLSRVLLGSVADDLIHRLNLPIIVVPMTAAQQVVTAEPRAERELQTVK